MLNKIQPHKNIKDLSSRLKTYRGANAFEALRLATEDHVSKGNKQPVVFLFTIGNLNMRRIRATFSSNFFGCAGYKIIDNDGFKTVNKGVAEAINSNADIVVICSSDEEYIDIAPDVCKQLKDKNNKIIVIVAGYPAAVIDQIKKAGIDDFIHIRSNLIETLQKYNHQLGI